MKITPAGIAVLDDKMDSLLSRWVERDGSLSAYDPRIEKVFAALLEDGDTVIDGGANIGDHTVAYAKAVGPTGRVLAFEPFPPAFECLQYNTQAFDWVVCLPLALANKPGRVELHASSYNAGATYVGEENRARGITSVPIDLFGFPRLALIKLDLEGGEMRALCGALSTLSMCRPLVIVETGENLKRYGSSHERLVSMMELLGYGVENLPAERVGDTVFDVLFRPNEQNGEGER